MWVWSGAWGAQQTAAASLLEFADDDLAPIHIAMQQWKQLGQDCGMRQGLENKHREPHPRHASKKATPHSCSLEALSNAMCSACVPSHSS